MAKIHSSADLVAAALSQAAAIAPADAAEWLGKSGFVFVDVRDAADWPAARIPPAVSAPRGMLEFYIDPASEFHLPALGCGSSKYVFYCGGGARAALAACVARQMGLDACSLAGGFKAWTAAGLPRQHG